MWRGMRGNQPIGDSRSAYHGIDLVGVRLAYLDGDALRPGDEPLFSHRPAEQVRVGEHRLDKGDAGLARLHFQVVPERVQVEPCGVRLNPGKAKRFRVFYEISPPTIGRLAW
jgi:hypothetical protein